MVKPNWRKAAAVVAALLAAQKAQPAKAESISALLSEWMDPDNGLEKTVATGKKLEAAVADRLSGWFRQAASVITTAPIAESLKDDAMDEVEQVVRPTPTATPYGPPPVRTRGPIYTRNEDDTDWEQVEVTDAGEYRMRRVDTGEEMTIPATELGYYTPTIGARRKKKTRRGKRKTRRMRRAKSLRRR